MNMVLLNYVTNQNYCETASHPYTTGILLVVWEGQHHATKRHFHVLILTTH